MLVDAVCHRPQRVLNLRAASEQCRLAGEPLQSAGGRFTSVEQVGDVTKLCRGEAGIVWAPTFRLARSGDAGSDVGRPPTFRLHDLAVRTTHRVSVCTELVHVGGVYLGEDLLQGDTKGEGRPHRDVDQVGKLTGQTYQVPLLDGGDRLGRFLFDECDAERHLVIGDGNSGLAPDRNGESLVELPDCFDEQVAHTFLYDEPIRRLTAQEGVQRPIVHLHNHTSYSVRDGLQGLDEMCRVAAEDGQPAIAITDHGSLGGAWKLQAAAQRAGIKPIIGQEVYIAIGDRTAHESVPVPKHDDDDGNYVSADGPSEKVRKYHHLTLLAESPEGWRNLALASNAAQDSFWTKPRMDMELLAEHSAGVICLTGCLGGPVASRLAVGNFDGAKKALSSLVDVFGRDSTYVEVMEHGIKIEEKTREGLLHLAKTFSLPVVATNDSHFTHESDEVAHDAWLCVGSHSTLDDPNRWRFSGHGYHLRSAAEMRAIFDGQPGTERALDATLEIAERVAESVLPEARLRLPRFRMADGSPPPGGTSAAYLYQRVKQGAHSRYGSPLPDVVKKRLRSELDIIASKALDDYFLIVADVIDWARSNGIRVGPGRGSAAGSVVSYCLGIITVDPLAHGLLFERFLNPDRAKMPDIDTDFEVSGRDRVVAYLSERWGRDSVARIGTYGFSLSRSAVKSAGTVLGKQDVANRLSSLIPDVSGGKPASFAVLDTDIGKEWRQEVAKSEDARRIVEIARGFEGVVNSESVHPCGVLVSDTPLPGFLPLRRDRRPASDNALVCEWDGRDAEEVGLLKLDILGIRNLDAISACVEEVHRSTGEVVDADNPPTDPADPRALAAWRLIGDGRTSGVFQLESTGMTRLCQQIQPENLDELAAVIALFRPGPLGEGMHDLYASRKVGSAPVDYGVFTGDATEQKALACVLGETFGVPVFQEQLMQLGEVVAGFGPNRRAMIQHAISKKDKVEMATVGELFVTGATSTETEDGRPKLAFEAGTARKLWAAMKGAGSYAFNKSHAIGYAKLAYITAYLKANWPAPFAASLLAVTDGVEKRQTILGSLVAEGISVAVPDVNRSHVRTAVDAEGLVRIGIGEVKGVVGAAGPIVEEREARGDFTSLGDFITRVRIAGDSPQTGQGAPDPSPAKPLSTGIISALIDSGALDSFGPRAGLTWVKNVVREWPECPIPDMTNGEMARARAELSSLGALVGQNPVAVLQPQLAEVRDTRRAKPVSIRKVLELPDGRPVSTIGTVVRSDVVNGRTRRAYVTLAGSNAQLDCVIWQNTLARLEEGGGVPPLGHIVCAEGKLKVSQIRGQTGDLDDVEDVDGGQQITRVELIVNNLSPVKLDDAGSCNELQRGWSADEWSRWASAMTDDVDDAELVVSPYTGIAYVA